MNGFPEWAFNDRDFGERFVHLSDRVSCDNRFRDSLNHEPESPVQSIWRSLSSRRRRALSSQGSSFRDVDGNVDGDGNVIEAPDVHDIVMHEADNSPSITPVGFMDLPVFKPPEGVYCIYGRPGSGKTVFASALVDHMLITNPGLFSHVYVFVPGDRPEWLALKRRHTHVTILRRFRDEIVSLIVRNQRARYQKGKNNKIIIILDDQMGQGQGIHTGPIGDLIDRIAASNRQPELNIVFFVLAQHVTFIPPSMRVTTRMMAYTQPSEESLSTISACQGFKVDKAMVNAYAQANQFVVFDFWANRAYATKSYHIK